MKRFNYSNNIDDPTALVLQKPNRLHPNFLKEGCEHEALNICLSSNEFYSGMSYFDFVSQYVNRDVFAQDHNRELLEDILICANYIFDKLKIFNDLGAHFSLFIAGGAVRDMIVGKAAFVKDFDFYVSFDYNFVIPETKFLKNPIIQEFRKQYPEHLFFKAMETFSDKCFKLDSKYAESYAEKEILSQDITIKPEERKIKSSLWHTQDNLSWNLYLVLLADLLFKELNPQLFCQATFLLFNHNYSRLIQNNDLLGVLKVDIQNSPCDIVFVENSIDFFSSFDWEICKAGFTLYNPEFISAKKLANPLSGEQVFFNELPKSPPEFVSRFFSVGHFFHDIATQKLTYMVKMKPSFLLSSEMYKRCQYLKKKFPTFTVSWNIDNMIPSNMKAEDAEKHSDFKLIKTFIEFEQLECSIPQKDDAAATLLKF